MPSLKPQKSDSLYLLEENFIAVIFVFYVLLLDCLLLEEEETVFYFILLDGSRNDWSFMNYIPF